MNDDHDDVAINVNEFHFSRMNHLERSDHLDLSLFLHFSQNGTVLPDALDHHLDVVHCDLVHVLFAGGSLLAVVALVGLIDGWLDLVQELGQVTKLHVGDSAADSSALGVAHDQDKLSAGDLAGKLHGSEDISVADVSGHSHCEDISESTVEDKLNVDTRVDAGEDHSQGLLTLFSELL